MPSSPSDRKKRAHQTIASDSPSAALIYCRVSSERQFKEGHGLEAQEQICSEFAAAKNLKVEKVFRDEGVTGGRENRPGIQGLIKYISDRPHDTFAVIFDHPDRLARSTAVHISLRLILKQLGAVVYCINFNFEDTPEGELAETVLAGTSQYLRQSNRRQVIQKMRARLQKGYWPFDYPPGYKSVKDPIHGKLLVRDEPKASIVTEALEGFASGRFQGAEDVRKFLDTKQFVHRGKFKGVYIEQARRLLHRVLYAGYVEMPEWDVPRTKGHHEPLISLETFERIQSRLNPASTDTVRKDTNPDFPLRRSLLCSECRKEFTASWTTKPNGKRFGYYRCQEKGCPRSGRSISKVKVETEFQELLRAISPKPELIALLRAVVTDIWKDREDLMKRQNEDLRKSYERIQGDIRACADKLAETRFPEVEEALSHRIVELKAKAVDVLRQIRPESEGNECFETTFGRVLDFMENPVALWDKGDFPVRRVVLKMLFSNKIAYDKERGYETASLSLPFEILGNLGRSERDSVEMGGVEPPYDGDDAHVYRCRPLGYSSLTRSGRKGNRQLLLRPSPARCAPGWEGPDGDGSGDYLGRAPYRDPTEVRSNAYSGEDRDEPSLARASILKSCDN